MVVMKDVKSRMNLKPIRIKMNDFDCWVSVDAAKAVGLFGGGAEIARQVVAISACREISQKIYKEDKRSQVREVFHLEKRWVVKHMKMRGMKAWIYRCLRVTPPWREWRGCLSLAETGCDVVAPLGVVFKRDGKYCGVGDMVLPHINGGALYEWLIDNRRNSETATEREVIARRMGEQVGKMTRGGLINRDIKPSNWVIRYDRHDRYGTPIMIDLAGMRNNTGPDKVLEMLGALYAGLEEVGGATMGESVHFLKGFLSQDKVTFPGKKRYHLRLLIFAIFEQSLIRKNQSI